LRNCKYGKRTVTAYLRVTGYGQDKRFQSYHRVLNRARWSALQASQVLLRMLVTTIAPRGELVIGIDDTIKRRRGQKIKAKGIYRDPVRSSHSHFVKASGLRWLCSMLLVEIYTDTAVWYCRRNMPVPIHWVLIRDPLGEFDPQALLSINLDHTPLQILSLFVRRWRMEVIFEEAHAHLGIETQRQWVDLTIARTTPALFGLFSVFTLMADRLIKTEVNPVRTAAWNKKQMPTFADAIAMVRRCLWSGCHLSTTANSRML